MIECRLQTLDGVAGPFDAAVGWLILMYLPKPVPDLHCRGLARCRAAECAVGGGDRAFAWTWANVMRGVLPLMERFGITTAAYTLADRLWDDLRAADGIVISPPMVGAWARLPE
jgi:hypothetical protein